ncbi:TPA: ead/Ea22-like family protein [Klebsiella variicola]|nr:ead/Ea22-like family protein [Klebsiella variicola]
MTTDITELAQSLKAAAIDAKELAIIARYSKGRAAAEKFYALANPNNVIALVEALELKEEQRANWSQMAQKLGENLDAAEKRIAELEETEQKLCAANTTLDARAELAERQLAEMESRTVKLPDLRQIVSGDRYVWSDGVYNYSQDVKVALAAAGIKVEAE